MKIVKETHCEILLLVNYNYLLNKLLIAGIKFKMKLCNPPKMSFETLDEYDDVCVPGNTWKSLKKLIVKSSYKINYDYLLNKLLIAGIKFKMKLWKPPKMSFETLDEYDDVWVPGNT
ncbi:protein of unknown function [Lactiplantibacillus plantarum]